MAVFAAITIISIKTRRTWFRIESKRSKEIGRFLQRLKRPDGFAPRLSVEQIFEARFGALINWEDLCLLKTLRSPSRAFQLYAAAADRVFIKGIESGFLIFREKKEGSLRRAKIIWWLSYFSAGSFFILLLFCALPSLIFNNSAPSQIFSICFMACLSLIFCFLALDQLDSISAAKKLITEDQWIVANQLGGTKKTPHRELKKTNEPSSAKKRTRIKLQEI